MINDNKWLLWDDISRHPFENMATDELLLENILSFEIPVLRIYSWSCYEISIGYVQNYNKICAEIQDLNKMTDDVVIVRRPTGGGVVYHDFDMTYTVVIPKNHYIEKLDRIESYHIIHNAVLKCFSFLGNQNGQLAKDEKQVTDRSTMQCFTTPTRYDVLCENRKFAGSAQRRTKNGILHQGSITLDASNGNQELLKKSLIRGFESQLSINFESLNLSKDFFVNVANLANTKYAKDEWNQKR